MAFITPFSYHLNLAEITENVLERRARNWPTTKREKVTKCCQIRKSKTKICFEKEFNRCFKRIQILEEILKPPKWRFTCNLESFNGP